MTKVYIVTYDIGGGYRDIETVYTSRKKAQAYIDERICNYHGTKDIEREKLVIKERLLQ